MSIASYPFSVVVIIYAFVFVVFLTVLFVFHTSLISEFKTTQEKLKQDKGLATGNYVNCPHRYDGNKFFSILNNFKKALCCRNNKYFSKITWELYLYSMGYADELNELWEAEEKRENLINQKGG